MSADGRRTVVVTGASAGLGYHAAEQLAASGHRVVLATRDRARAAAAEQQHPPARGRCVVGARAPRPRRPRLRPCRRRRARGPRTGRRRRGREQRRSRGCLDREHDRTGHRAADRHEPPRALRLDGADDAAARTACRPRRAPRVHRAPVGPARPGRPVPRRPVLQLPAVRPQQARRDAVRLRTRPAAGGRRLVRRQRRRTPRPVARRALTGSDRTSRRHVRNPRGPGRHSACTRRARTSAPSRSSTLRSPRACARGSTGARPGGCSCAVAASGPAEPRAHDRTLAAQLWTASERAFRGRVRSRRTRLTPDSRADVGPLS